MTGTDGTWWADPSDGSRLAAAVAVGAGDVAFEALPYPVRHRGDLLGVLAVGLFREFVDDQVRLVSAMCRRCSSSRAAVAASRSRRGENCCDASCNATTVSENVKVSTVITDPTTVCSSAVAAST